MDFDWMNLPEPLWIKILQQLNKKSLLNASETCTTFNNLMGNTILTNKLNLIINVQSIFYDKIDKRLLKDFKQSNRNYNKVLIYGFQLKTSSEEFQLCMEILNLFTHSIKEMEFYSQDIQYCHWKMLLKTLKNVETFDLCRVNIFVSRKLRQEIDSIPMSYFRIDDHIDIFDNVSVKRFVGGGSCKPLYDQFFLKHKELVALIVCSFPMFENDKLSNVTFSLERLSLFCTSWKNKPNALKFIRTQTNLQKVYLKLSYFQYDILFLKHIINNNPNLDTLLIDICDGSVKLFENDIHQINTNFSVTHFYFRFPPENSTSAEKVFRLFPNNKAINDHILFQDRRHVASL